MIEVKHVAYIWRCNNRNKKARILYTLKILQKTAIFATHFDIAFCNYSKNLVYTKNLALKKISNSILNWLPSWNFLNFVRHYYSTMQLNDVQHRKNGKIFRMRKRIGSLALLVLVFPLALVLTTTVVNQFGLRYSNGWTWTGTKKYRKSQLEIFKKSEHLKMSSNCQSNNVTMWHNLWKCAYAIGRHSLISKYTHIYMYVSGEHAQPTRLRWSWKVQCSTYLRSCKVEIRCA